MITTIDQLYDFVNRFRTPAMLGDTEGRLQGYGSNLKLVAFYSSDGMIPIKAPIDALADLKIRQPGPEGKFVPIAEFDNEAAAALVERWEARHSLEMALKNAREATEHLRTIVKRLHIEDRAAVRQQYGLQLENLTPEYEDGGTVWPDE